MTKRGGLGRGLSALIPGAVEEGAAAGLLEVPVEAVQPNPRQPRSTFDDDTLETLSMSIREVGVLQPIVVPILQRPAHPDGFLPGQGARSYHQDLPVGRRDAAGD